MAAKSKPELMGFLINVSPTKTTPIDADRIAMSDSEDSNLLKKLTWVNLKATLKTYFDTIYVGVTGVTDGDKGDITVASSGTVWTIDNVITEAKQVLADNTTQDVSITKHGYTPKAPNDTAKFLRGDATWATVSGGVAWGAITGTLSSQTDLQTALDGKSPTSHNHDASYAAIAHTHAESDVTGLVSDLAGKSAVGHTHVKADVTDFAHTHAQGDVTNLVSDLAGKQETLVSGTNIKTVNSQSLLGSGDLALGGGGSYTDFTKNLGVSRRSGTFDITGLSGLTADKVVSIVQTAAPIASKGNARDEPEMDLITATGYVVNATTIRAYWQSAGVMVGDHAFAFQVSG